MPCNRVAVITCQLAVSVQDIASYAGATDALAAMLASKGFVETRVTVNTRGEMHITTGYGDLAVVDASGNVRGNGPLSQVVRTSLETLSTIVLIEITRARVEALAKATTNRQYLDNGALVLTVDL